MVGNKIMQYQLWRHAERKQHEQGESRYFLYNEIAAQRFISLSA
jgi:hypothetical protein